MKKPHRLNFRDVDALLQYFRNILLGRKHVLHNRFMPFISPRTIPPADVPRGPEMKLSDNYYHKRSAYDSVWPPIVAPVAEGPAIAQDPKTRGSAPGGLNPSQVCFICPPTPGPPWWWDGHCYYEYVPEQPTYPCETEPYRHPPCCDPVPKNQEQTCAPKPPICP